MTMLLHMTGVGEGEESTGSGCGGETAGAHVGQVPVGSAVGQRRLHVGTARVWF
jgi:hypothetical protein